MSNPTQNQSNAGANLTLTAADLANIIREAVESAKAPYIDPAKESQIARNKQRMQDQLAESAESIKAGQDNCSHLREDNTSRVAWAVNYVVAKKLYIKEGFCQACNKHFAPGVDQYGEMLRVPTGRQGLIQG